MTSPLREMAVAASAMARGDYDRRVRATSRDEVGELARAFNAMAAELAGVERMRRDLVANVSHELRTPIGALQALLENLADGVEPPDPATLRTALAQTERLGRLVEQLLDLSRMESGGLAIEPVSFALRPLLEQATRECELGEAFSRARVAEGVRAARRPARHRRPRARPPGGRQPARQRGPPLARRTAACGCAAHAATTARTTIEICDEGPGIAARRGRARVRALLPRRRRPQRRRTAAPDSASRSRAGSSTPTAARSARESRDALGLPDGGGAPPVTAPRGRPSRVRGSPRRSSAWLSACARSTRTTGPTCPPTPSRGRGSAAARCCSPRRGPASGCSTSAAAPAASSRRCGTRARTPSASRSPRRRSSAPAPSRPAPICACLEDDGTIPLGHHAVDLVWCSEVLEHAADAAALLHEARRVLKPGGRLLVTVPYHGRVKDVLIALTRFDAPLRPARASTCASSPAARSRRRSTPPASSPCGSPRRAGRRCCASRWSRSAAVGLDGARRPRSGPTSRPGSAGSR